MNMSATDNFSTMTNLITQSRHCATLLDENLQLELEYLQSNNAKDLILLSQKKESLMQELQALDIQRKKLTTENGITNKEEYMEWLMTLDSSSNLKNQWLDFSAEILNCQQLNSKNGITNKEEYMEWLMTLDSSSNLKNQWLDFSAEILNCQQLNSKNGIISESMNTASRQALNILSGNTTPAVSTYSASGRKTDNASSLHTTTA